MQKTTSLTKLERIWAFHLDKMQRNYDRFIAFTGIEGSGKSRGLFLPSIETWYRLQGKETPAGRYGVHVKDFKKAMLTAAKYDWVGFDETGDIMQKEEYRNAFNSGLYKASTVVREELFMFGLVMPSFFDFPGGLRLRRITGLFHVHRRIDNKCLNTKCQKYHIHQKCPSCGCEKYKPGYIIWRYYNRTNLNKIVYGNQFRKIPTLNIPGVHYIQGTSKEYKGSLLEEYIKLKKEKTQSAKEVFAKTIETIEHQEAERKCRNCGSRDFRYSKAAGTYSCRSCPNTWEPTKAEIEHIKQLGGRADV